MNVAWFAMLAPLAGSVALAEAPKVEVEVVVRPTSAPGPLDNPLKGWCPYTDAGPIRQPYSMVFLYMPWKEWEPERGRYAFEEWERRAWSSPEAQAKHVVLRPYIDYPSRPSGMPDWLAREVKSTPYLDHGGGTSPDYDDPRMIEAMERLIEAMGRRYDHHPRVAFVQLGLLGFWGEWHTWPRGALYAGSETERRVIEAYRRAFPNKILMARSARGEAGSRPWLGFHDDMFPEDTDNGEDWSFLAGLRKAGRLDNWERAAIGGEMVPFQARAWLGDGFEQTVRMVERGHFSWVGPYGPALEDSKSAEFLERSRALVRRMGYQFRLEEVRHPAAAEEGESISVAIRGENEGVVPFSYPWPVEVALLDEAGGPVARFPARADVRSWKPGPFAIEARFEVRAAPGRYQLALGIIDPWTARPAIRFANALPDHQGWAVLSRLVVNPRR